MYGHVNHSVLNQKRKYEVSTFSGLKVMIQNVTNLDVFFISAIVDFIERSPRENTKKVTIWRVFAWRPFAPPGKDTTNRGENAKRSPRENPPIGDFFVFSHGDLSPRHTKVRDIPCVAFSATVCRFFAWRGERSPCENPTKSPFGGFSRGDLSRFRPRKHVYTTWHKSATIKTSFSLLILIK